MPSQLHLFQLENLFLQSNRTVKIMWTFALTLLSLFALQIACGRFKFLQLHLRQKR